MLIIFHDSLHLALAFDNYHMIQIIQYREERERRLKLGFSIITWILSPLFKSLHFLSFADLQELLLFCLLFHSKGGGETDTMTPLLPSCLLFLLLPSLTNARVPPLFSPANQPTTLSSASMAPPPLMMQIVVVEHHHHYHKELALSIALASVAVGAIILSALCAWVHRHRNHQDSDAKNDVARGITLGPILRRFNTVKMMSKKGLVAMFDYDVLVAATGNFSDGNILGEGGFGCVYKACFEGGIIAAVKKLDGGGQECEREFENELELLGRIRHPNIVSLLGYCIHGETRFIIYELMPNGCLEKKLHGPSHGSALTWHIRMKIALDAARGIEYLHEHCNPYVIHRDLKSSNILLDSDFNAKISDFGLAVIGGNKNNSGIKLSGTPGYVAPEYILHGKLTEKSDVYAFGVVLLELLIGRKPVEKLSPSQCQSIVAWAMPQLMDRSKLPNIVDPAVRNTMDLKHLYQVAAVAVLCIQPEPSYRPLITDVLHSLIPLVPIELGGTLRLADPSPRAIGNSSAH